MKRTKLKDRVLPTYSKGEEIFNMVTHIVGGGMGIITLIAGTIIAILHHSGYALFSIFLFAASMIVLYTMSSIYHGLSPKKETAKKVLQVLDHCTIFALIAGSYTPFALCSFRNYDPYLGWGIFTLIWGFGILGIVLNSIDLKKYKVFSMICYLVMGWCIIFKSSLLPQLLSVPGTVLLVLGGIFYTIGAIFYVLGRTKKWMHSIFHLFILFGNLMHILCILIYVI